MASNRPGSDARKALKRLLDAPFNPHRTPHETSRVDLLHGDEARDTAVVIVTIQNLALCLQMAIERQFVKMTPDELKALFDLDKPLSSLSAKINLAYALGIAERYAYSDLHRLRHIRNAFAHTSNHASFKTDEIVLACNTLRLPLWTNKNIFKATVPRDKFIKTAQAFIAGLYKVSKGKNMKLTNSDLYGAAPAP